jgi:hypothetical protein
MAWRGKYIVEKGKYNYEERSQWLGFMKIASLIVTDL